MNRKLGVFLLCTFGFLGWLFFAVYFSAAEDWWTVIEMKQTSYDTFSGTISFKRVAVGFIMFIIVGILINNMIKKD
ncbi:hypothetical protein ACOJQI_10695 [Bacillus salacetis]|uniref:hypothetical protein n=1 Tax=Bacillus salacetis TaxID=2315464 RepID=UPI003BA3B1B8